VNIRFVVPVVVLIALAASLAHAADPPHTVGRVVQAHGQVTLQNHQTAASENVEMNWPLAAADQISTGTRSQAELGLSAAALFVEQQSMLTILDSSPSSARLRIDRGVIGVRVYDRARFSGAQLEVAGAVIALTRPGSYRIDVRDRQATFVVNEGTATVTTLHARFEPLSGERVRIASDGMVEVGTAAPVDSADGWPARWSANQRGSKTEAHVARNLIGYEELDEHGVWRREPVYGMVWEPRSTRPRWAPYRFGHWVWKSPWGWTWIDEAPWGFATTHYGRWAHIDGRWKWLPGPRQIDAVYAPAVVGWITDAGEQDLVGWFPLGPSEEYVPLYFASALHKRRLNTFASIGMGRNTSLDRAISSGAGSNADVADAVTWTARGAFAGHPLPPHLYKHVAADADAVSR
jgi:hypothetical protein